jgi:ParB family transcriptional regulator, chromosome partitioning protein
MKSANDLRSKLGANMRESMGAHRPDQATVQPIPTPAFHGGTKYQGSSRIKDALVIDIDRISPDPDQPRREFPEGPLQELADSLKSRGQLQPIRVRWSPESDRWVIVAGERRYRAALMGGLPSLMAIEAKGDLSPDEILEDQLVENLLRDDLKPIEQAHAFKTLIERRGWTYRQLSERLSVSTGSISRALALLTLPEDVQRQVEDEIIPASAASELAKIEDESERRAIVEKIASGKMTRDETVAAVRESKARSTVERGITKPAKGRGVSKSKALPNERTIRTDEGIKVIATGRKGLTVEAWVKALRYALNQATTKLDQDQAAA